MQYSPTFDLDRRPRTDPKAATKTATSGAADHESEGKEESKSPAADPSKLAEVQQSLKKDVKDSGSQSKDDDVAPPLAEKASESDDGEGGGAHNSIGVDSKLHHRAKR